MICCCFCFRSHDVRRSGVLGQGAGPAAAVQDGEPEAVPAAAAALQVRLQQHRRHRVRAARLHGPPGQQRAHRHVAQLAAPPGRRLGFNPGTSPPSPPSPTHQHLPFLSYCFFKYLLEKL